MRKAFRLLIIAAFAGFVFAGSVFAQDQQTALTREITSDDFAKKRPATARKGTARPAKRYRYRRKAKPPRRRKAGKAEIVKAPETKPVEVQSGVTMWKLRPPFEGETGPFLPVKIGSGTEMWTPERVSPESGFEEGDRLRFAIESTTDGFVYVFNSEIYLDGTVGDPYLIFPESPETDNRVFAGLLVDIPDQTDEFPYFLISTKRRDYAGEAITVVISKERLKGLETDGNGRLRNPEALDIMGETADSEVFTSEPEPRSILTSSERAASCGAKTRGIAGVSRPTEMPCAMSAEPLTSESPLPDTIFKSMSYPGKPIAFSFSIRVREL